MISKYFIYALIAVLAIQVAVEAKNIPKHGEEELAQIKKIVNDGLEESRKTLTLILTAHSNIGVGEVTSAITKILKKIDEAILDIANMIEIAQSNGLNVDDCVVDYQIIIRSISEQAILDLTTMFEIEVNKMEETINVVQNTIQSLDESPRLEEQLGQCKDDSACISKVIVEAKAIIKALPARFDNNVQNAAAAIGRIGVYLVDEIKEENISLLRSVDDIWDSIAECIANTTTL